MNDRDAEITAWHESGHAFAAVWLGATRPESSAGHFWHDRAQRPTTFGWQRRDDPEVVAKFLAEVSRMTQP